MVDDIIRLEAHSVERTGRMEVAGHAGAEAHVLPEALEAGALVEVGGADAFAHHVPVGAAGAQLHLVLVHDLLQLLAHFADFAHGFAVDVVVSAPDAAVAVLLPLVVDVKEGEVVALRYLGIRVEKIR